MRSVEASPAASSCSVAIRQRRASRSSIATSRDDDPRNGKRIANLVAEHKHQCPQVEELLTAFRGATRLMERNELLQWINNRVSEHMEPVIEGTRTRKAMHIAHFLYRLGFILARSDSPDGGYEHYRFDQMPDFLTSRTDHDFGLKWEIHPCYREALDINKLDQSHRARFSRLRKRR